MHRHHSSPSGRSGRSAQRTTRTALERINRNAAGIDCGASAHYVAVPPDRDTTAVRSFPTFTGDLHHLADWLTRCRVTDVAMEATGVYWIPVFEILEARGFHVSLVNARHVKHVPGRKSDVSDCEWLRDLHMMGLLRGSFRPTDDIVALRAYLRHRATLVASASEQVQRMQKALVQMNVQLPLVVSDIMGVTGQRILRAIVAGERDAERLAAQRDFRCHASKSEIIAALTGNYRPEHVFALTQHLALFDVYQQHLTACDGAIAAHLAQLVAHTPLPPTPLPAPRRSEKPRENEPRIELRQPLHRLTGGVDLSQIDAIGPYTALRLIAEIGTDMTRWPTAHHFTSWLTLAPRNQISGGRLLGSRTQPSANRAAHLLRLAAMSLGRTQTALGAFYRRLAYRVGKAKAITATARKLAILVYRMLNGELAYHDLGATAYDAQQRERALRTLRRRATRLGFGLLDLATGEVISANAVS
jgi:transposase